MGYLGYKPADKPLTSADITDSIITSAKITDGTIALADLSATGTKDATTFLRGDNTFSVPAGGVNTPAFFADLSSSQSITTNTFTKVQFNNEILDSNTNYDNATNYRFTPTTSGKYFFFTRVECATSTTNGIIEILIQVRKNGNAIIYSAWSAYPDRILHNFGDSVSGVVSMNGTTDYLEVFAYTDADGSPVFKGSSTSPTYFGAYKLIGA